MSLPMEFWGVEVKAGQPLKVDTDGKLLHLSQASLGESKSGKRSDFVPIHVKFGDQKLVLGTLSPETIPQLSFDLVFEKEFELFHDWKNGSVYFCGYLSSVHEDDGFSEEDSDTEEEDELELPAIAAENGKSKPVTAGAKQNQQPKPKVSLVEPMKVDQDDDSDDDDDDDEDSDSEDDSDEDDSDEDVTPKKAESGKKRPAEPAAKTPTPNKKAKASTPQRTGDGKKGVHTATPHPAKQTGKQDKSKDQPQKSPGQLICKSCSKTFNSDNALKSHSAAKHGAK